MSLARAKSDPCKGATDVLQIERVECVSPDAHYFGNQTIDTQEAGVALMERALADEA